MILGGRYACIFFEHTAEPGVAEPQAGSYFFRCQRVFHLLFHQDAGVFCGQAVGYPRYNVPRPGVLLLAYPINNFYEAKPIYRWLIDTYSEDLRYYDYNISGCVTPDFPPTYFWYGLNDILLMAFNYYEQGPALQKALARNGVPYHESVYKRAFHGIGIAEGTDAEGWLNDAAAFWEEQTAQAQQPAA